MFLWRSDISVLDFFIRVIISKYDFNMIETYSSDMSLYTLFILNLILNFS